MQGKRLLERLRTMDQNPDWRGDSSVAQVMASVKGHLQKILNTRQGTVPIAEDYGIPDFTSLATLFDPSNMPLLEEELSGIISRYEPRLSDVRVRFSPSPDKPMTMVFHLQAQLITNDNAQVMFETVLCPDGHVEIVD